MEKALDVIVHKHESLEDWVIAMNGDYDEGIDHINQVEDEHLDLNFTNDVSLDSLVDSLVYNGFTEEEIQKRNVAQYGNVIDFYQISKGENKFFIMSYGQR